MDNYQKVVALAAEIYRQAWREADDQWSVLDRFQAICKERRDEILALRNP